MKKSRMWLPVLGMLVGLWAYTVTELQGWSLLLILISWATGTINLYTSHLIRKHHLEKDAI